MLSHGHKKRRNRTYRGKVLQISDTFPNLYLPFLYSFRDKFILVEFCIVGSSGVGCGAGCGAVQCGAVWCCVVRCGVVWCGVMWCGVVWCGVVQCGAVWCGGLFCFGVIWCLVNMYV